MKLGTQAIIGATIVALGLGFLALGALDQESNIRSVEDVREDGSLVAGTYTLLGVPQPEKVPITGAQGVQLVANDQYQNFTTHTVAWQLDGQWVHSEITLRVEVNERNDWYYENVTRVPGQNIISSWNQSWQSAGIVFQIRAFDDGDGDTPIIWGEYHGVLKEPMQPKPSQFEGRRASQVATTTLPPDALVWHVETYTAGCSSKFLPPEEEQKYEDANG